MKLFRMHWSQHPLKDLAWYERKLRDNTRDAVARELDINYSGSVSGTCFPEFAYNRHVFGVWHRFNKNLPVYRIWDFGTTNCVLYAQVDNYGRKTFLHERILTPSQEESSSSTDTQVAVALADSERYFEGADFFDICDPAGSYKDHRTTSTDVDTLHKQGIFPLYRGIQELSTKTRKLNSRKALQRDLQRSPGGKECIQIFSGPEHGCPTLAKALAGEYRFKKDRNGKPTDIVEERHPYEDVMDCVFYLYQEAGLDRDTTWDPGKTLAPHEQVIDTMPDWGEYF